jgi:hypothetical protein
MSDDNLDKPLWGAPAISAPLGLTERQFYHKADLLLREGVVRKVGATFLSTPRRIQNFLNGSDAASATASGGA